MGIVIIIIAFIAAVLLVRSYMERRALTAEHYSFVNANARETSRLVFLTDIHDRLTPRDIDLITGAVRAEGPDLILIGGDVLTVGKHSSSPPEIEGALRLIGILKDIAPVIYGEGNHEQRLMMRFPEAFGKYLSGLRALGISYLSDQSEVYGGTVISSISLPAEAYDRGFPSIGDADRKYHLPEGFFEDRLGSASKDMLNILLLHSPLYIKEAHDWGAKLVLSGHFHGGTVRLPLLGGLMTTQFQFFLPETAGRFRYEDTTMIVSRGIGTHAVRLRLNDLPEVTVVDIKGS